MITIEQIDELRKRIDVSYEDAKEALEINNGDIIDAITYLERNDKTQSEAREENNPKEDTEKKSGKGKGVINWCKKVIKKGSSNYFSVKKYEKNILEIPVILLVVVFLGLPRVTLFLLILAFITGHKLRFIGSKMKSKSKIYN